MNHTLRRLFAVFCLGCACSISHAEASDPPLKFGITAVILQDQNEFLAQWETHLESRLDRDVEFVQRGSYAEISELLSRDAIDIAWVCGAPYVRHRDRWRLVAVPLADGKPHYQSYLIVRAGYAPPLVRHLQGTVFRTPIRTRTPGAAVRDAETGIPRRLAVSKTFFTWSHHDTVGRSRSGSPRRGPWTATSGRRSPGSSRT